MKYKTLIMGLLLLAISCVTPTPAVKIYTVEDNPLECGSRSLRGQERNPCTTFRLACPADRRLPCRRIDN